MQGMQDTWVPSLAREDPLESDMTTYSTLADYSLSVCPSMYTHTYTYTEANFIGLNNKIELNEHALRKKFV